MTYVIEVLFTEPADVELGPSYRLHQSTNEAYARQCFDTCMPIGPAALVLLELDEHGRTQRTIARKGVGAKDHKVVARPAILD